MILRLIIAFTRWVWGVSPAFVTPEQPLSDGWFLMMFFGVMLDVAVVAFLTVVLICWIQGRRAK